MSTPSYTDLTTLKSKLQIAVADTESDTRINRVLGAASRVVDLVCRRQPGDFAPQTLVRTFDVRADQAARSTAFGILSSVFVTDNTKGWTARLRVPPLISVSSLQTDEDGDGTFEVTWNASNPRDYLLYPLNQEVKREIVVDPSQGRYGFPPGLARVQVTGTWGQLVDGAVPAAVAEATLILAGRYFKRDDALFGMLGDQQMGFQRLMATDPDVAAMLWQYGGLREQWLAV